MDEATKVQEDTESSFYIKILPKENEFERIRDKISDHVILCVSFQFSVERIAQLFNNSFVQTSKLTQTFSQIVSSNCQFSTIRYLISRL